MSAGRLDLLIEQGSDFAYTFTWKDSAGDPVDLTGHTARAMIRMAYADDDGTNPPLLSLTTENGGITLGGPAGTIALAVSAAVTAALTWGGLAYWDLEIVAGASVERLLQGRVTLSREVTR